MDRGIDTGATTGHGAGDGTAGHAAVGRIPLAVVVVDRAGLVSHWSTGARRLFGTTKDDAVGHPALDLLPVSGALPDEDDPRPTAPTARTTHSATTWRPPSTDTCPTRRPAAPGSPCPAATG